MARQTGRDMEATADATRAPDQSARGESGAILGPLSTWTRFAMPAQPMPIPVPAPGPMRVAHAGTLDDFGREPRRRPRDNEMRAGRPPCRTPSCKAWRTIATLCMAIPGRLRAETPPRRSKILGAFRGLCGRREAKANA